MASTAQIHLPSFSLHQRTHSTSASFSFPRSAGEEKFQMHLGGGLHRSGVLQYPQVCGVGSCCPPLYPGLFFLIPRCESLLPHLDLCRPGTQLNREARVRRPPTGCHNCAALGCAGQATELLLQPYPITCASGRRKRDNGVGRDVGACSGSARHRCCGGGSGRAWRRLDCSCAAGAGLILARPISKRRLPLGSEIGLSRSCEHPLPLVAGSGHEHLTTARYVCASTMKLVKHASINFLLLLQCLK
jgi:hypothetical protein